MSVGQNLKPQMFCSCMRRIMCISPNILRSAEIIEAKKSKIMYMKGEESIRSSTSPASAHWSLAGGGS